MIYSSVPAYIIHSFVHLLGFVVIWRFRKMGVPQIIKIRPWKSILGRMRCDFLGRTSVISWGTLFSQTFQTTPCAKCLVNMVQHLTLVFPKGKNAVHTKTSHRYQDFQSQVSSGSWGRWGAASRGWDIEVLSSSRFCKCVESNQIFCGIHGRLFHFLSLPHCGSDRKWKRRPWMPIKIWFFRERWAAWDCWWNTSACRLQHYKPFWMKASMRHWTRHGGNGSRLNGLNWESTRF